ncbi:acyltransferase family protein [uncultured Winogradskyella sp.]|uniref:acyltransferase family protein n=1 Tax=uncultured Winogradskyella sp. TaxID=395353 RepID=UPI003516B3EE
MIHLLERKTINIAKALVITSVVLGHILEGVVLNNEAATTTKAFYDIIYLVHMPFYFLLSGFLFKGAQPQRKYFIKKTKHLLVPYTAWLVLFNLKAIAGFTVNALQGQLNADKLAFYKEHFYSQLYGGMEVHGYLMILWFPMCLFFTQQVANLLLHIFKNRKLFSIVVTLGFYVLGYINQFIYPQFHLPLALNIVAGALPFFMLGFYLKQDPLKSLFFRSIIGFSLICGIVIYGFGYPLAYHMRAADYGVPVISTLAALGGFLGILVFSQHISNNKSIYTVLWPISRASMTIMYVHAFILTLCRAVSINNGFLLLLAGVLVPTFIDIGLRRQALLSKVFVGALKRKAL